MIADLTFWQEFGTFFIAVGVGAFIAAVLILIGGKTSRVYESTMLYRANHFRGLSRKMREKKRASYEGQIQGLREKASAARRVQLAGLYGGTVFLAYHLSRAVIGINQLQGALKWVMVIAIPLLATAVVALVERRATRARTARLDDDTDLSGEREAVS